MTWGALAANIAGVRNVQHAVLTFCGTWGTPGTQYPSDTVNGLAEFVDDGLCYEVPVPYPASFGPIGGPAGSLSYQESVTVAENWAASWIQANPVQTFILGGYSQGAEAASRLTIRLMSGDLQEFLPNFIGGYTFGNPCRMAGAHAPTIADPGGRGISSVNMTELPTIDGRVVWADYVHSPANGDAGLDMYASVPVGPAGDDMTLVYGTATNVQLHNLGALTTTIVDALIAGVHDLGIMPGVSAQSMITSAPADLLGVLTGLVTGQQSAPTNIVAGGTYAIEAAIDGIKFLAAPGGPTAPHISYLGEIGGYSNLVADAVGFLHDLATAVPARCAA
nr:PE-PPE domain-containing protein [Mycobacterium eburneum]